MFIDTKISNLVLASLEMKKVRAAIVRADANAWQREHMHQHTETALWLDIVRNAFQTIVAFARHPYIHVPALRS